MIEDNQPQLDDIKPDFTATDPYAVLGLKRTASQIEIKRTYFTLIRQYPPETQGENFKIIRAAYEKIKDAGRRKETDIFLPYPPPEWSQPDMTSGFITQLASPEILAIVYRWGELSRSDFEADYQEIKL